MKENEQKYIDKHIFVEIIYLNNDKSYKEGIQLHGIIKKISQGYITIERADNREDFIIPFDEKRIMERESGEFNELEKINKTIGNVDFIYSWRIVLPEENELNKLGVASIRQQHKELSKTDSESKYLEGAGELRVGDRIWLSGGYDDAKWLNSNNGYWGTVDYFIPGQNEMPAAVIKLDQRITFEDIIGDIVVLELRWKGAKWGDQGVVHVELCNFLPEHKTWKERRQGKWVESHANFTK